MCYLNKGMFLRSTRWSLFLFRLMAPLWRWIRLPQLFWFIKNCHYMPPAASRTFKVVARSTFTFTFAPPQFSYFCLWLVTIVKFTWHGPMHLWLFQHAPAVILYLALSSIRDSLDFVTSTSLLFTSSLWCVLRVQNWTKSLAIWLFVLLVFCSHQSLPTIQRDSTRCSRHLMTLTFFTWTFSSTSMSPTSPRSQTLYPSFICQTFRVSSRLFKALYLPTFHHLFITRLFWRLLPLWWS